MIQAPIPENDKLRVETLKSLALLDTEAEERFDRITRLGSQLLNMPIVLVSLVDENRQWFKSKCGLDAPETGRDVSFCGHAILSDELFCIPDALKDERFFDNPLVVGPPHVIFYAGRPLKARNGHNVGTLCFIDNKPRNLEDSEVQQIKDLGAIAENEINVLTLTQAMLIQKDSEEKIREVMDNLDEGLFLIQSDLTIGSKYSQALEVILEKSNLGLMKFIETIRDRIPLEKLYKINDYLELMFQSSIHEDMVNDLNPLREIELHFSENSKYLKFKLRRVMKDNEIIHLVVTVVDITKSTLLSKEIAKTKEKTQSMMEKMFDVLHVEPAILNDFLDSCKEELNFMESVLKNEYNESYLEKMNSIFRSVHSIKGDAALLGLKQLVENAHGFEDKVGSLIEKESLSQNDFVPITIELASLEEKISEIESIVEKLSNFQKSFGAIDSSELLLKTIETQIERLVNNSEKKVSFDYSEFNHKMVPLKYRKLVKDVLIQLVRNSIDHGIETTEERIASNKSETGKISIESSFGSGYIKLTFKDDGAGLNLEKIQKVALEKKLFPQDQLMKMEKAKLAELIYLPGFSTANVVTTSSGRGIGMDIVKKRVELVKGKVKLKSSKGKFCEFSILLPF
ncbi:MAG: ATP-binding protein [Leptospiraceae bacterium]|nr:ATP-binding protein [Leptospiraceae bacterium]